MIIQRIFGLLILATGIALAHYLSDLGNGRNLAYALLLGLALGFTLQRTRFCFLCHARDWFEQKDPRGLIAILTALAVGSLGYTIVLGGWLAVPEAGRLPPDAHIGPVSWALALAGVSFGLGMYISGSCISAHLYRLGEGSPSSPFALLGTGFGFLLGFNTWNPLYSATVAEAPLLWLPHTLGYGGTLLLQLAVLGSLIVLLWQRYRPFIPPTASTPRSVGDALFEGRWPYWSGGLVVGLIGVFILLRLKPLGVTAFIGSTVRRLFEPGTWVPIRLDGLDGFAGCATVPGERWLTPEFLIPGGIVLGALAAGIASRQFQPRIPTLKEVAKGLVGGTFLGWGAMTGLGCTIGTLLSGIQAGAVSGWLFALSTFLTLWVSFTVAQRWQKTASTCGK